MNDTPSTSSEHPERSAWWREAVLYQIYLRSFADGNGDGMGDIQGIRSRLGYLRSLNIDAIWINPWYPSPMADGGYDVADFRDIDPRFGTLAEAEQLIAEAHEHGLRVIADIVPNHTSDQHAWFRAAKASAPGSIERQRYFFRTGQGPDGAAPPNNWQSVFGGPAWTRITEPDGQPGQWYLHLFAPEQPDLNWENPEVRAEFESIIRFWFDRGVDGFRIDVANGLIKHRDLPDLDEHNAFSAQGSHPHWDRDEVHEIYKRWREIADSYPGNRTFVAEAWTEDPRRLVRYLGHDRLHSAFNFDFLLCEWNRAQMREVIDTTLTAVTSVGAPATWVLSNHDVVRHLSRFGHPPQVWAEPQHYRLDDDVDMELGERRARAAALLTLSLPGGVYIYQGEELGLPEVEDLPEEALRDPIWERSGHTVRGRDGCRVPLPWSGNVAPFGFSPEGSTAQTWLPQPPQWKDRTVEAQELSDGSMLQLYRQALQLRRDHPALGQGSLRWWDTSDDVLAFHREPGFACVVNFGAKPSELPAHHGLLLSSGPVEGNKLPPDTAVWLSQ